MSGKGDTESSKLKGKKRSTSQRSPTDKEQKKKLKMSGEKDKEKKKSPTKQLPKDDASVSDWAKHILTEIKSSEKRTADKIDQLDTNIASYKKDHADQIKKIQQSECMCCKIDSRKHLLERTMYRVAGKIS